MLPQLIYVCLVCLEIGYIGAKHGTPKKGHYNLWLVLSSLFVVLTLQCWGGFYVSMTEHLFQR